MSLKRFGSAGLAYAAVDQDSASTLLQTGTPTPGHSRVATANYSLQLHHVSIYASEFRDLAGTSNSSRGLQVGLTIPIGRRTTASVNGGSGPTGRVQVQKTASRIGEWGYDA